MMRDELGEALGANLIMEGEQGDRVNFRRHARDEEIQAATSRQRHFFVFLDRIVRDAVNDVPIALVENSHAVHIGTWYATQQVLDVGDIEGIPEGNEAFTRVGCITHEIAERFWLVTRGFRFEPRVATVSGRAVLDRKHRDQIVARYFRPAHAYALQQEAEVTGWRQIGDTRRSLIPAAIRQNPQRHRYWFILRQGCGIPEEDEFVFEQIPPGSSRSHVGGRRVRRRVVYTRGSCLLPDIQIRETVEQVPAGSRNVRSGR